MIGLWSRFLVHHDRHNFYDDRGRDTWLGKYGFCAEGDVCVAAESIYIATLSHTLQLICGAAGGALDHEVLNSQEQIVYGLITSSGALLWGYVIARWVGVVTNVNPGGMRDPRVLSHRALIGRSTWT